MNDKISKGYKRAQRTGILKKEKSAATAEEQEQDDEDKILKYLMQKNPEFKPDDQEKSPTPLDRIVNFDLDPEQKTMLSFTPSEPLLIP